MAQELCFMMKSIVLFTKVRYPVDLTIRTILHQIFELLSQQADHQMYLAEIARTLGKDRALVSREIRHLEWTGVVEVEKREGRVFRHTERRGRRVYYRLRPGMAEQYQEWLSSPKPDEPQP